MKNKHIFQEKITRLESILNATNRAISTNERQQAFDLLEKSKEILMDMQTMLNREEETYR